ncbi:putative phosphatidylinositol 3-kinase 2 [Trypanosoma conorhini]|uniref:Putative phosphatidylinositol 3-kinase 2 n=1 Tax=Trypanosoma conorhini TaxID=83891 RepID=A0A3R7NTW2_9TRYP|nr:putative phosphatidylinositol 3-kinase 2 [Trypanosoma conorhini]RNF26960.1 putative phosphatidylinositol 3-kinase 2 [Trypanosoma conorhini]
MSSSGAFLEAGEVSFKEELEEDDIYGFENSEEFERVFAKSKKSKRSVTQLSTTLQALIFQNNGIDAEAEFEAIVEYILGAGSHSYGGSLEAREYRRALLASFEYEWQEFQQEHPSVSLAQAMRILPYRFTLPPMEKTQLEMLTDLNPRKMGSGNLGTVLLRIWYIDLAGCTCSTLRGFPFDMKASEAILTTMERLFSITNFDKSKRQGLTHVFKIQGRREYVYGDEILINFRYIRDSVTQQREINVVVEPHEKTVLTYPVFVPSYSYPSNSSGKHRAGINRSDAPDGVSAGISVWDIHGKLGIKIKGRLCNLVFTSERAKEEGVREGDSLYLAMLVEVYYGAKLVCPPQMTNWVICNDLVGSSELNGFSSVTWGKKTKLAFDIQLSNAPRELKLCITLLATCGDRFGAVNSLSAEELVQKAEDHSGLKRTDEYHVSPVFFLGVASVQLFDYLSYMQTGKVNLRLWGTKKKANPMCLIPNNLNKNDMLFSLTFPTFNKPVLIPNAAPPDSKRNEWEHRLLESELCLHENLRESKIEQLKQLKRILASDPLTELTTSDKVLLWKHREELIMRPRALAKFLLAVNWLQPYAVYEAHSLLKRWAPLQPMDVLELLDIRFVDILVREHAVKYLNGMTDYELKGCVLQLVQVLKHEPYHDSTLSRFLLKRSLQSPNMIGHYVFWYLVSEMGNTSVSERYGILLEELIRRMPERRGYLHQLYVADQLFESAMRVKEAPKRDRIDCLREHLKSLSLPPRFTLPLNPAMECCGLDIGKCKVMDSKKFPLWLVFRNFQEECEPFYVIFKAGDDLRQDLLTLQLLELMDSLWKSCGLYLHIIPYGCIATGEGVGMIEVVPNSDTVANITRKYGGAQAAFRDEPLMNWLRQFNRERDEVERCLWNFICSVAGYTVATYVLGIGDRHNDNIMLRQDGTLFHIDFGHFLGNFKTKFGIKRETAPFIFTPMYAYMLGGQSSPIYVYFVDLACHAYNVLRRFGGTLMTLFMLMLSTGIPELQKVEDIGWLRTVLLIDRSSEEATEHYKLQISLAMANFRALFNDYIHIVTH